MKFSRKVILGSMSIVGVGLAGCDVFVGERAHPQPVYVQQQQPVYVEQQPQYVIVQEAPPAEIVERRPPAPSGAQVWIGGYWNWDNQRYNWQGGHYAVPPRANVVWVAPRYEREGHGYRYTAGQWRNEDPGKGHNGDQGHG